MNLNPSRLTSQTSVLVLDASVLINLLGTGQPLSVLRALRRDFFVEEITLAEVRLDPLTGKSAEQVIAGLQNKICFKCPGCLMQHMKTFLV